MAATAKAILVVEDNEPVRRFYAAALRQKGHQVDEAGEGQEAFRLFVNRGGYDLVIMDINMPNWDGVDAIRTMSVVNPQTRIVVVSGVLDQERYQVEHSDLPILAAYQKPLTLADLNDIVDRALKEPPTG